MKKNLSILTAMAALWVSLHPASASLIGTPLNLMVAIDLSEANASKPACQFYTDDVFTGPLLVKGC
jgi:hypothetical protein